MASPTSDAAVEHEFWYPDVPCLIASLTLVSAGCYILYRADPVWAGFATFVALAGNWPLLAPAERRKSRKFLPSSPGGWKVAIVIGLIVLAIPLLPQSWFEHLKGSPSSDRSFHAIMQNPVTDAALWFVLCSFFTWKWLRFRRVAANEAGSLA